MLAADPGGFFTIAHSDNYPADLVQLDRSMSNAVREVLLDGLLMCAPVALHPRLRG